MRKLVLVLIGFILLLTGCDSLQRNDVVLTEQWLEACSFEGQVYKDVSVSQIIVDVSASCLSDKNRGFPNAEAQPILQYRAPSSSNWITLVGGARVYKEETENSDETFTWSHLKVRRSCTTGGTGSYRGRLIVRSLDYDGRVGNTTEYLTPVKTITC